MAVSEVPRKPFQDFDHGGPDPFEMTDSHAALPERYSRGEIALHVHLWFWERIALTPTDWFLHPRFGREPDTPDLCTVFHRSVSEDEIDGEIEWSREDHKSQTLGDSVRSYDRMKGTVFVGVGEFPQDGEGMEWRTVPTAVGLESFDAFDMWVGDSLQLPKLVGESTRPIRTVAYRHLIPTRRYTFVELDQLPNEVVQARAQVMDNLAHSRAPSWGRVLKDSMPKNHPFPVELWVNKTGVWLRIQEGFPFPIERFQLLVRPLQLDPTTCQRRLNHGA